MPFDTGETMVSAAAIAAQPRYDRARAVAHYSGNMRKLVHDYKYRDQQDARTLFVTWLANAGHELLRDCQLIVPVPLHRWRLLTRRFNQSALLARQLALSSNGTHARYSPDLLIRKRRTKPQVGLTQRQRRDNLAGAFSVPPKHASSIKDQRVLLIDDVITTGATANACARALKASGARQVDVLALAMVVDRGRMTT